MAESLAHSHVLDFERAVWKGCVAVLSAISIINQALRRRRRRRRRRTCR
jgi:hypothetical protein